MHANKRVPPRTASVWRIGLRAITLFSLIFSIAGAASADDGMSGGGASGDLSKFPKELNNLPAMHVAHPDHAAILGVASAGNRYVAVGDHGVVLLSDDDGKTWRQAKDVPTRVMLNSVCFIDARRGWAVGHWGEILRTTDGGETWALQRTDTSVDQPLFSVYFSDANHGVAVGLWSLVLRTTDGGTTWNAVETPAVSATEKAGPNLYQVVPGKGTTLFVAAEQGYVFKSNDSGETWTLIKTGSKGSLWTGLVLPDSSVLMAGLAGKCLRSTDDGRTWNEVESGTTSSITALILNRKGGISGVGLDGAVIEGADSTHLHALPSIGREALAAIVARHDGGYTFFSAGGVVSPDHR